MAKIQGNPEYKDSMEGLAREPATPEIFNIRFQILLNNDAYLKENKLDKTGDAKDVTVTFTEAEERENIASRDTLKVIFGKISKFFSDLKKVAFSGSYNDLEDKPTAEDIGAISEKNILHSENLDDIKTTGLYYAGDGNTISGKPSGVDSFGLLVMRSASGRYTQILYDQANGNEYTRRNLDDEGFWSEWTQTVKGVKGNAESEYRTGNVNITPKNIGAFSIAEGNELKKSVSDGKSGIASAITSMGVTTASDATFATMSNNIKDIIAGDASASNVLTGKTFSSKTAGRNKTGTMKNNGAVSKELSAGGSYTIPTGYHNGYGKVTAKSLASQTGVDSGKTAAGASQILTGYQAWVNGSKITGTIMDCRYTDVYGYGRAILAGSSTPYFAAYFLCHIGYDEFGLQLSATDYSWDHPNISNNAYWQASKITGVSCRVQTYKSNFTLDITNYTRMVVQIQAISAVYSGSEFLRGFVGVIPEGVSGSTGNEGATNMTAWAPYSTTNTKEWEWITLEVDLSSLSGNHNFAISTAHGGFVQITGVTFLPKGR